jgi:Domain of unknown function (DUF4263)
MSHRNFDQTYELASGPAPEAFDTYADRAKAEFSALLDTDPDEKAIQKFFEQNPCFVPGLHSLGSPGAFPRRYLLITQPPLPGLRSRVPDLMWIAYSSVAIYPTLIELERPGKRLFTKERVPYADFAQARHQLAQWRGWFSKPENVQKFIAEYGVAWAPARGELKPQFILVYGRRAEFQDDAEMTHERAYLLDDTAESLVSYDRIGPDRMLDNAITVKPIGNNKFRAIAVPPTFTLGPLDADRLPMIDNLDGVLAATDSISPERRAFLRKRLPYWQAWAQNGAGGMMSSGDYE